MSIEKIISPVQMLRSPGSKHRTPNQGHSNYIDKNQEKEELSNFSLSRKGSDDRRSHLKNRKLTEEHISVNPKNEEVKEQS